ncbi:MAG: haloacid dehalogenase [Desulfurococcaceae archaeon]
MHGSGNKSSIIDVLSRDIEYIDSVLKVKDSVREDVIKIVREITRYSGDSIRYIHTGDYHKAKECLEKAGNQVVSLKDKLRDHPDLYYSGLVYNGLSEYVEALLTYSLVVENKLIGFREIDIPIPPYLQGLGDVVGELRRYILTLIGKGAVNEATHYLELMEIIYEYLKKLIYPDPLTPGLRHKIDIARRLIEDTKTLLISIKNMNELSRLIERELEKAKYK